MGAWQRGSVNQDAIPFINPGGGTPPANLALSAAGNTPKVDCRGFSRRSIQIVNPSGADFIGTLQGSNDGTNWVTVAYGLGSNTAYVQTAFTVAGGATGILFLPPDDVVRYLRMVISTAQAGVTATLYMEA